MDLDQVTSLEEVRKGVELQRINNQSSMKCHSRSNSHDSYFEMGQTPAAVKSSNADLNAIQVC